MGTIGTIVMIAIGVLILLNIGSLSNKEEEEEK